MKKRTLGLFALLHLATFPLGAQTLERQVDFMTRNIGDTTIFAPVLPPLVQMAGAPQAYYEHYWEFGDGQFSFAESPRHVYADTSSREAYYLATGKYDNGKAPKPRKKNVARVKPKSSGAMADAGSSMPPVLPTAAAPLGIRAVRNPRAGEELACIVAYANRTPASQSGTLYLFYNQKDYQHPHFTFKESRTHYGESELAKSLGWNGLPFLPNGWAGLGQEGADWWYAASLPDREPEEALSELETKYRSSVSWHFDGLMPDELRHLFFSLEANATMLADTNAIITISGLLISDDRRVVEQYDLEMEIVASHDPNYIAVSHRRTGFRGIRGKDLVYKVHFQNNGEGPASKVAITCDVPPGLNASRLQVLDLYPQCLLCPDQGATEWSCLDTSFQDGKVVFTFQNIYLPGTRQEGINDRDSTKGFVKFRLLPDKKIRKQRLDSRAEIVFDKNPPIRTNQATTAFKPGFSPGLMAGWNFFPDAPEQNHAAFGVSVSPFSPFKRFLQAELWLGLPEKQTTNELIDERYQRTIPGQNGEPTQIFDSLVMGKRTTIETSRVNIGLVPLEIRKNWSDFFSTGAGVLITLNSRDFETRETGRTSTVRQCLMFLGSTQLDCFDPVESHLEDTAVTRRVTTLRTAVFADLHIGSVRKGPALALRPILRFGDKPSFQVSAFAYWKF
ncbi:MAG: hypothetical protein HUU01_09720 [Saprospiraceae bacterium]|nr:hypothetical protein [Saprospiraceae bacterium]